MRRQLMKMARQLREGIEPPILKDATLFRVRPVDIVTDQPELVPIWQTDHAEHDKQPIPARASV
jgi:hypothetical protein